MTDDTPGEAGADVDHLVESLRQCRRELASARRELEARAEALAPLELAERQLHDVTRILDRHLTKAEEPAPLRRTLFSRRPTATGPTPAELADLERIRASPLFDGPWYLQEYPKVIRTGLSPALHFLRLGAAQRKDPGPSFSVSAYLVAHPGLPKGTNPLLHYLDSQPGATS